MSIMTSVRRSLPVAALAAAFAFTPVALAQDATPGVTPTPYEAPADLAELSGEINADGSSTVGPLTTVASETFFELAPNVNISVNVSGTGGGFESFCNGDTDIQNASRDIAEDEIALCGENAVDYYRFTVAYDGISVVVPTSNTFLTSLTTEQLRQIWMGEVTNYNELDESYPDLEISLFGPDDQSGTYDFFNEEILGEDESGEVLTPAADYEPSSDDNTLVEGVAGTEGGLGFFGFSYYEENADRLNVVSIAEEGGEPVTPSLETISDGSYAPLSRNLYIFVSAASLSENVALQEFLRYYIASAGELALSIGSVAAPGDAYVADQEKLEGAISGEVAPDSQAAA